MKTFLKLVAVMGCAITAIALYPTLATSLVPFLLFGAVAGLRGTGSFSADERPKNYRDMILLLFPNTKAALTAVMGRLKEEVTDDPEFKIFQKGLPVQRALVNGAQTNVDTTIELSGSNMNKIFKAGHVILNERTLELLWVTDSSTANQLTVVRGKGGTSGTAMNDQDGLLILGSHHAEGASVPAAIAYDPTVVSNYTQIFRTVINLTETVRKTRMRTGDVTREAKREALEIHGIEIEKQILFGGAEEATTGGQYDRTTKGALNFITTNVKDFADSVTLDDWDNFMEDVFENGSNDKLCFLGNRALNVVNKLASRNGAIQIQPTSNTYGMQISTWVTPFGTLHFKQHPLFSENATFNDWGFIFDTSRLVYRYLKDRDTQYLTGRAANGDDAIKEEYLTECGLEVQFEQTHAVFKNASAYTA